MHRTSAHRRHADCRRHLSRQSGAGRRRRDAPKGISRLLRGERSLAFAVRVLFWDELFESDLLHCSFDWVPHCLNDRSFAHRFAAQIDDKLEAVRSGRAFNLLPRPIAAKWGRPNGIFAWDHVDADALRLLLSGTSGQGIATIIGLLCRNFRDMRDGFPDLMLEKDGAVSFMEIKAEGDMSYLVHVPSPF